MELQQVASFAVPALGVVVWLLRLEGRIGTVEAMQKKIGDDVEYIRNRVDEALSR
jgi:hypothetical protein